MSRQSRMLSICIGGAALVAGVLFATASHAQNLRMWAQLDPNGKTAREMVLKKLIDQFEAANPGVKILTEPQVWQQMSDKFLAAHQTGTAPDIMWVQERKLFEAIHLGSLANLDDLFIDKWSQDEKDDIAGPLWNATPGAHYIIQHTRAVAGAFYRVDLFKQAGIDARTLTSWDKFIAAAQKLTTTDANGNVTRWGFGQAFATEAATNSVVINVMLDRDKTLFDDKLRAKWATPAGIDGLTLEVDMIRKHKITPPSAVSLKGDDLYDHFNAGRYAIIRGGPARLPRAQAVLGAANVGYLQMPSYAPGKFSPGEASGWDLGVWSGSKHKELAGKFVEFISSGAADAMWVKDAGMIPMRKSTVKNNPQFFADPKNAWLVDAAEAYANGWVPPPGAGPNYNEELNKAAQDVLTNGTDIKTALEKAEVSFNRSNRR